NRAAPCGPPRRPGRSGVARPAIHRPLGGGTGGPEGPAILTLQAGLHLRREVEYNIIKYGRPPDAHCAAPRKGLCRLTTPGNRARATKVAVAGDSGLLSFFGCAAGHRPAPKPGSSGSVRGSPTPGGPAARGRGGQRRRPPLWHGTDEGSRRRWGT